MLIPPFFIDCVAALGYYDAEHQPEQNEWFTTGTGFFYGNLVDPAKRGYATFLVTAKHVVQSHIGKDLGVRVRVNSKAANERVQDFELSREAGQASCWFFHPNDEIDVAVIPINWDLLKERGSEPSFFTSDCTVANRAILKDREVAAGDGIFVLGFPMGLTGEQRNYVIVRQGCIARISEMLDGISPEFLIDAPVYPGNSGGPVILRPEFMAIQGTKSQETSTLLGLVTSYLPYEDVAISQQTNRPRVTFEENSGLAMVLPVDFIDETISAYVRTFPTAPPAVP